MLNIFKKKCTLAQLLELFPLAREPLSNSSQSAADIKYLKHEYNLSLLIKSIPADILDSSIKDLSTTKNTSHLKQALLDLFQLNYSLSLLSLTQNDNINEIHFEDMAYGYKTILFQKPDDLTPLEFIEKILSEILYWDVIYSWSSFAFDRKKLTYFYSSKSLLYRIKLKIEQSLASEIEPLKHNSV